VTHSALRIAGVAALVAGSALAASAQPAEEDPRATARAHLGPFYFTPSLALPELGVDTNVFNEAGEQKSDFTFTLAPHVDVWLPLARRALIKSSLGTDLVYYQTYDSERSVDPSALVRGELYLHRLTVFAEPSARRSRQRPNFEIDARSRRLERAVLAGVDFRVLPKLSVEVSGRRSSLQFDADEVFLGSSLRETLNRDGTAVALAARWRVTALTTVVLRGEAERDRFPFSPVRNSDSVRILPGVEFKPRALLSGSAYVGVRRFQSLDDAVPDYRGVVASASLAYTLAGSTTVAFMVDRDVQYSFESTQPYYVATGVGIDARRHLGGRFDVTVGAQRHVYAYRNLGTSLDASPEGSREDAIRNYSASLGYRLGRQMRLGVGASYWRRASPARALRNYDGLRIGTSVSYGF
jgi:hypothetical protein